VDRPHAGRHAQERSLGPGGKYSAFTGWQISVQKKFELPVEQIEASIRREFNLAWPGGLTVGRGEQAVEAWRAARAISGALG
jgi:hypothetical protein